MCCVRKSIEFAWRWYWRQNVHVRCIVKITVVGFIHLWPYVTLGDLNSSQLLTPTENPNTPWCKKRVCVSFHRRNGLGEKSLTLMFFIYDLLNSKEAYEPKKPWEREEHAKHSLVKFTQLSSSSRFNTYYHMKTPWWLSFSFKVIFWISRLNRQFHAAEHSFSKLFSHKKLESRLDDGYITCYPTKWTSIRNNVLVKTANGTTNKRTSFAACVFHWHIIANVCLNVCVATKKLIIREYI